MLGFGGVTASGRVALAAAVLTLTALIGSTPAAVASAQARVETHSHAALGMANQLHPASDRAATHPSNRAKGTRHAARALTSAPPAEPALAGPAAAVLHNFNGVSSRDSEVTNFDVKFEPPDQGLCAGNGFVLEPVNSAYRVYRPNGQTVIGPFNVNDLYNEGAAEFTSDPRCHYDPATNRWFAIILFINSTSTRSHLDVAVSQTGDPTGLFKVYRIDTTSTGPHDAHPGCPCFGDQPTLGIDEFNIYVSTQEFGITSPAYNGAQIYAIAKADLVAGRSSVHYVHFDDLSQNNSLVSTLQPALTTAPSPAEFFMNSIGNSGAGNHLGVWAMTNRQAVQHGGVPTLESTVVLSEAFSTPPPAIQKGSSSTLDSGDSRMQQTQYINGTVWGELDTAVTPQGDTQPRAGAAWFQVRPSVISGHLAGASVAHQGYVAQRGKYLLYPALQANAAGAAVMVLSISSASDFPSAGYAARSAGSSKFAAPVVAAAGSGPYSPTATRWGDYSWAVTSPTDSSVWMATEYVPPKSSQTDNGERNWGTRVLDVAFP